MDRDQAIKVIVNATRWLTTSRDTHMGLPNGRGHTIAEEAGTADLIHHVRGVYFGRQVTFDLNHKPVHATPIKLIDYNNPGSADDHVPCTSHITHDDFRLGIFDHEQVDVDRLSMCSDGQLERMATNAMRVMYSYYGRQDMLKIVLAGAPRSAV